MPDGDESCKNRPASHTSALGSLFIPDEWAGAQGGIYKVGSLGGRVDSIGGSQAFQLSLRNMARTFIQSILSAAQTSGIFGFAGTPEAFSPVTTESPRAWARAITNGSPDDRFLRVSISLGWVARMSVTRRCICVSNSITIVRRALSHSNATSSFF